MKNAETFINGMCKMFSNKVFGNLAGFVVAIRHHCGHPSINLILILNSAAPRTKSTSTIAFVVVSSFSLLTLLQARLVRLSHPFRVHFVHISMYKLTF